MLLSECQVNGNEDVPLRVFHCRCYVLDSATGDHTTTTTTTATTTTAAATTTTTTTTTTTALKIILIY